VPGERKAVREIEREEAGGEINCCFIMFSSDSTLAVIMVGEAIAGEEPHYSQVER